jgi:hypothetical protein
MAVMRLVGGWWFEFSEALGSHLCGWLAALQTQQNQHQPHS